MTHLDGHLSFTRGNGAGTCVSTFEYWNNEPDDVGTCVIQAYDYKSSELTSYFTLTEQIAGSVLACHSVIRCNNSNNDDE